MPVNGVAPSGASAAFGEPAGDRRPEAQPSAKATRESAAQTAPDAVSLSPVGRALGEAAAGKAEQELRLSPEQLREMVAPPEAPHGD